MTGVQFAVFVVASAGTLGGAAAVAWEELHLGEGSPWRVVEVLTPVAGAIALVVAVWMGAR